MAGLFLEQSIPFFDKPNGIVFVIVIVLVVMIFLVFYVTRGKTKEQLKLSMELEHAEGKFKLLASQIEGICFLYQPEKDEMLVFEGKPDQEKGGIVEKNEVLIKDFSKDAEEKARRYFEDFKDFELFTGELKQGRTGVRLRYPLKREYASSTQKYMEVKADYLPAKDSINGVVVGTILVKDDGVDEEERIDKESTLLKKDIIEKEISYLLKDAIDGVRYAFLLLRVSNYKQYVENFSSDIPKMVDGRIGDSLRRLFREKDLMGRVSEDTYAILMDHITSREDVSKKAEDFREIINKVQRESEGGTIEVNFGISIYPMDGENYEELYDKALHALDEACQEGVIAKCFE